jgi:streptomycin 6-kinase
VDPKGVIGEHEYEVGALLRNPIPGLLARPDPRAVLDRRLRLLAETLGFDLRRLRDWALAQAVLSAWWSIEDTGAGWEWSMTCAEHLAAVRV